MSFLYPIFIYLMLPLTLVLFYFIIRGSQESFLMFDEAVLARLRHENKSLSTKARNGLFLLSFLCMILALSQPVIKEGEIVVEAKSADILVGIDISDSMKAEDRYPNRLDFAKAKAIELIKQAPHNRIGVLAFAKHDYIVSPLSFDHSSVAFLLSKIQTGNITEKGTRLDSMLRSAISMLEHADIKNLLLFTDGGDEEDFSKEIELAKDNGLRLFIIGVGSEQGSPVRTPEGGFVKHKGNILISKLNSKIQSLATQTGGVYIESVLADDDIKTMLKEIESITEKSTLKKETIPQYTQLFYYPLALAVLFLLLGFSSLPRRTVQAFLVLLLLSVTQEEAKAGLLDFQKLHDAKAAYLNENYNKSISLYEDFAIESPEAVYNLANSLYKEKKYERALKVYNKVSTDDKEFKAKALHNSGNTHVKLKQYEEALKSYEEALKLKEDKETKENYEAVKKFLEEQKKQDDKKDQPNDDKNESDEKKNSEQKENSDKNKSEDSESQDEQNKEGSQSENKQKEDASQKSDQKKSEQKSDNEEKKKDEKSDSSKQDEKLKDKEEQQDKSKASSDKPEDDEKKEAQEENAASSQKDEGKDEKSESLPVHMKKMSDLEAKKWLKAIQQSQKGHLYKMQELEHDEDDNEKPW